MSAVVSSNGLSDVTGLDGSTWLFHRGRADLKHTILPFYTNTELRSRVNKNAGQRNTFLRFLCLARPSRLPFPCGRVFDEWEEPGVEGGVASGESGSFFTC